MEKFWEFYLRLRSVYFSYLGCALTVMGLFVIGGGIYRIIFTDLALGSFGIGMLYGLAFIAVGVFMLNWSKPPKSS